MRPDRGLGAPASALPSRRHVDSFSQGTSQLGSGMKIAVSIIFTGLIVACVLFIGIHLERNHRRAIAATRAASAASKMTFGSTPNPIPRKVPQLDALIQRGNDLLKLKHGTIRTRAIEDLIREWMHVDPRSALKFLVSLGTDPIRPALSRHAIEEWLTFDQPAALAFVKADVSARPTDANCYLGPAIDFLIAASTSPTLSDVMKFLSTLPPDHMVYVELQPRLVPYFQTHPDMAETIIASVPDADVRSRLHETVGFQLGNKSGFSALGAYSDIQSLQGDRLSEFNGLINGLNRADSDRTAAWLLAQPTSESLDSARTQVANRESQKNPSIAAQLAIQIANPDARQLVVKEALVTWLESDFSAAEHWAVTSGLPAEFIAQQIATVEEELRSDKMTHSIKMMQ